MWRVIRLLALLGLVAAPLAAQGKTHVHGYTRKDGTYVHPYDRKAPSTHSAPKSTAPHTSPRSHTEGPRSSGSTHSKEQRSQKAKDEFMRQSGHPHGWKGHVVDHIVPLACGGSDSPSNMQWQTTEEAKAKDKVERKGC